MNELFNDFANTLIREGKTKAFIKLLLEKGAQPDFCIRAAVDEWERKQKISKENLSTV
jgi:hypothetical protein